MSVPESELESWVLEMLAEQGWRTVHGPDIAFADVPVGYQRVPSGLVLPDRVAGPAIPLHDRRRVETRQFTAESEAASTCEEFD